MFERTRLITKIAASLPRVMRHKPDSPYTMADVLEAKAAEYGDHPFVLFEDRRVSYREMNEDANRVADWAYALGLRRGDVVALLMENRPEYLSRWMGLGKLGVVTALINTNVTGQVLRQALATSTANHLILGAECIDKFTTTASDLEQPLELWVDREPGTAASNIEPPLSIHELNPDLERRSIENPDPSVREGLVMRDDLLYLYTSGTTGNPKAARLSHLRFVAGGDGTAVILDFTPEDVHYCALPLYHGAGGIGVVASTLFAGATMALRRRFSASQFWDDIRKYDVSAFQYIGEFCRYLVNQPPDPRDKDHRVRIAIGNGLRADIWEEFRDRFGIPKILEFYGATEGNAGFMNFENKVGSVGRFPSKLIQRAIPTTKLIRYDVETDTNPRGADGFCIECGEDEAGELIGRIRRTDGGIGSFEGYTSKQATEKKILRDVFKEGDAYFRSGDLLKRDAEWFFYFVDRIGDTFRWKGENVSTQEVAEVLSGFPGLEMVNVFGTQVPGTDGRAGMVAFVLPEGQLDGAAFHTFVTSALPSYATPLFARVVSEPDVTGTFKLKKVALQEEGWDLDRVHDQLFFRDDTAGAYVPLTRDIVADIQSGNLRL